ncbi:C1 family peptidase [Reyranella sp.]|uniref:C1 family peptidase n=1 Tax=Reyranella sp. TaxID=1929291 RepID=UPI003F729EF8
MANEGMTTAALQASIQQAGAQWQAGDSPISALSPEQRVRRLGLAVPMNDLQMPFMGVMSAVAAPSKFDLRNVAGNNYITGVRDQGDCGSCVAFGCIATIEGSIAWQQKKPNPSMHLSEAHLFYCYGATEGANCGTGWWPEKAFAHCIATGIVDDLCFPYVPADQPCKLCDDWKKRLTKIASTNGLAGNPAAMKQWISTKGPLVGCLIVYDDFFSYRSGVYKHVSGGQAGGHCVSIVGYDDTAGCWICKNSWGPGWGEAGFFRIAYGQCNIETWRVFGVNA